VAQDVKGHFEERIDDAEELLEVESNGDEAQSPASGQAGQDTPAAEIEESEEPELQAEIERLKTEAAANLDGWQRALAEFNNYRKRNEAERSQLVFLTGVKIIEKLLPVIDDFDLALANLPKETQDDGWIEGVRITRRKLVGILESEGLSPIPVRPGDAFDPVIHEAMTHEESEEFSEGQIIAEVQTGYRIGDRLLRPSRVRVAR
jgi:molecular chaperone GrpE